MSYFLRWPFLFSLNTWAILLYSFLVSWPGFHFLYVSFPLLQLLKNYWLGQTGLFLEMVSFSSTEWIWRTGLLSLINTNSSVPFFFLSILIVYIYQFYKCAQTCLALFLWLDHKDYEFSPKGGYCLKKKSRCLGHPLIRIGIWLFRNPSDMSTVFSLELVIYNSLTKEWAKKKDGTENFNNDVNEAVNDLIRSKCWTKVRYAWWIC